MNLAKEYNHQSRRFGFWRDTHLLVEGLGVMGLTNIFLKDWYYATGQWVTQNYAEDYHEVFAPGYFTVVESGPDYENMIIKDLYFKLFNMAARSIKIETPYLILEPEMLQALTNAVKSGVSVEIIVPGKPDKLIMYWATKSYYEELLKNGIRIYEYKKVFIHSKVVIVDDQIASIGTVNIDPRSFNLNFEATAILKNDSVDELIYDFYEDRNHSQEIILNEWRKRSFASKVIQGFVNLFSPIL
jgi:cardiolipin synthase